MEPQISASAVVLSYNKREYTQRCLTSVAQSDLPGLEIIVVDQGSTDGTAQWLEAFSAQAPVPVRVLRNDHNVGACTGRNQGIAAAAGRVFLFLDNDVVVEDRTALRRLVARLEAEPDCGIVTAKLVYPEPPHRIQ
ncbi:MAG: glycosyltransferase family A protein, partial [Armatimonadota bacterium]|nr:glycosyltransferase family A protein [Armatimonadota bacterium]